ncbi:hypothetical protein PGB90_007026 [Kerria lacca]
MKSDSTIRSIIFVIILYQRSVCGKKFDVKVLIPKNVAVGFNVNLHCSVTCDIREIYTLKWYRGNREFYRYMSSETPPKKAFDFPGRINVNVTSSNITQVTLTNVSELLSGEFTCEVTTYPSLTTISNSDFLYVYDSALLRKPTIKTEERIFKNHKSLNIWCSAIRTDQQHQYSVTFYVNNEKVAPQFTIYDEKNGYLILNIDLFRWTDKKTKIISCRSNLPGTSDLLSDEIYINYDTNTNNSQLLSSSIICAIIPIIAFSLEHKNYWNILAINV